MVYPSWPRATTPVRTGEPYRRVLVDALPQGAHVAVPGDDSDRVIVLGRRRRRRDNDGFLPSGDGGLRANLFDF